MPLIAYVKQRFTSKSKRLIGICNEIIEEYFALGYQLTLRSLYYQLVTSNTIPNNMREYKKLVCLINDARLAGLVDWEAIVDHTRNLREIPSWNSPADVVRASAQQFKVDRWAKQDYRPEVWIEKDALLNVITNVCTEYRVPYFSCRGYTSQSEMWGAAQRLLAHSDSGKYPYIIHLGDHDPSGKDMTRDIKSRMELFGVDLDFKRIALNINQVRQYKLPKNPAKFRDSRYHGYVREFGQNCWELDALKPQVIAALIRKQVESLITNRSAWDKTAKDEVKGRSQLSKIAERFPEACKAASKRRKK